MQTACTASWSSMLALFTSAEIAAAPVEGSAGSNAAAILVVLGLFALVMGLRNLRDLRHKRLTPDRPPRPEIRQSAAESEKDTQDD